MHQILVAKLKGSLEIFLFYPNVCHIPELLGQMTVSPVLYSFVIERAGHCSKIVFFFSSIIKILVEFYDWDHFYWSAIEIICLSTRPQLRVKGDPRKPIVRQCLPQAGHNLLRLLLASTRSSYSTLHLKECKGIYFVFDNDMAE